MLILVRHGESEGNVDRSVYARMPGPEREATEVRLVRTRALLLR